MIADTAGMSACAEHVTDRWAGKFSSMRTGDVRRRARRNAGLAALVLLGCATVGSHRLVERLPAELPDAATIAGWQRYAGQAQMGDSTVVYQLYVNPVRPALYEITRYRVTSTELGADGRRHSHQETEKVLWNPAVPTQPLRAFEWITKTSWKKLWLGGVGRMAEDRAVHRRLQVRDADGHPGLPPAQRAAGLLSVTRRAPSAAGA